MKKLFDNALLCLWRTLMYAPVILTLGALLPGGGQLKCGLFYLCGQALALILSFIPARARRQAHQPHIVQEPRDGHGTYRNRGAGGQCG